MKRILTALAQIHTMISWFVTHGINRWDLAIRRRDAAFVARGTTDLDENRLDACIRWARYNNVQKADIYLRPARGYAWPVIFLDDVAVDMARRIAYKYAALVVPTSWQGGCQVWLHLTKPLDEEQRYKVQAFLKPLCGADPASINGEHWGRLAGTKNHKRQGQWTGILWTGSRMPYDPGPVLSPPPVN